MAAGDGPLTGIRVIDLATPRAELAGRMLADLGAEVIKVEPPEGAEARRLPPFEEGRQSDPDGSLYWAAVALGKRSVTLDLERPEDRERLRSLAAGADILVESFDPGTLEAMGLGYEALSALNPALVYLSVTPYGQQGPKSLWPASDLTLQAAGGMVSLQGDPDRPPIPVGYPQAAFHAAARAAADAVIALNERAVSGLGQRLDTSMQEAMIWTLMNATGFPPNTGGDPPGMGDDRAEGPPRLNVIPGLDVPRLVECADGYMIMNLAAGALGGGVWPVLLEWAEREEGIDERLKGPNWETWLEDLQEDRLALDLAQLGLRTILDFLRGKTMRELMAWATASDRMVAAVQTTRDLLTDEQMDARGYWEQIGGRTHPGIPVRLSRTPAVLRGPAPSLGRDQSLLDERRAPLALPVPDEKRTGESFAGLKVADFAWVGVGPMTSKALSDHGATVVHVESSTRPDVLRRVGPFKDNEAGLDRSQFVADFNTSKLGLALDMATEGGRELARRLIDWSDVVVESFTPGTMARWGLDWETISKGRPDLIMYSTCLRGQTGPQASYAGFGGQGAAIGGFHAITGWPDRPPWGPWGAYTDFCAPHYGVLALTAAILERRQSGLGQHIDLSQIEAAIHFIEPLVLDYTVNGHVAAAAGHDSATASPNAVYPTLGIERYIAISVESADQWRALRTLAPLDAFAAPGLDALAARREQRAGIDAALAGWCAGQDAQDLARRLAEAGVPASAVQRPTDLYEDPQLAHRGFFITLDHTVMGPTPYDAFVTHFSAKREMLHSAAPILGEHNDFVLREILGLSAEECRAHAAAGVLT